MDRGEGEADRLPAYLRPPQPPARGLVGPTKKPKETRGRRSLRATEDAANEVAPTQELADELVNASGAIGENVT